LVQLVEALPRLLSLNVRATVVTHEAGQRIMAQCANKRAAVLTGLGTGFSVYSTRPQDAVVL
jgi:hypothetical protein